jgi:hypothetical protein
MTGLKYKTNDRCWHDPENHSSLITAKKWILELKSWGKLFNSLLGSHGVNGKLSWKLPQWQIGGAVRRRGHMFNCRSAHGILIVAATL